jgi:hypothetical protein
MALLDYPFSNISFSDLGLDPETYMPTGTTVTQADPALPQWMRDAQNPAPVVLPPSTNPMLTGQEFAKMISGGQAVPSMFAPGVSYSSAQPMGYTAPGASAAPFPSYTGPMNVNPDTQPPPPGDEGIPVDGDDVSGGSEIQEYTNNLYGLLDDPNTYINWGFDPSTVVNYTNPDIGWEDITFDPSTYDWSTIFDQYSTTPDLSNYLTQSNLPTYTPIDTSQFLTQSNLPTYESPDLSNYLTSADLPTYTQFDPTNYDWSNIFSQPDLSNYALLSDIPTNNPMDTSSFVTQDQLANLLASVNTSSNQFNNNNFPLDTTDIIPLGSYSLLNR